MKKWGFDFSFFLGYVYVRKGKEEYITIKKRVWVLYIFGYEYVKDMTTPTKTQFYSFFFVLYYTIRKDILSTR